jgi:hypothetical protein
MAKRKAPRGPKVKRTHQIEVPTESGDTPQQVLDKIKLALDDKQVTDVFQPGDVIIVSNEEGGGGRTL